MLRKKLHLAGAIAAALTSPTLNAQEMQAPPEVQEVVEKRRSISWENKLESALQKASPEQKRILLVVNNTR